AAGDRPRRAGREVDGEVVRGEAAGEAGGAEQGDVDHGSTLPRRGGGDTPPPGPYGQLAFLSASSRVTTRGAPWPRTVSAVTITLATSSRLGISYMTSWSASSTIDRRPRAPVSRSRAKSAIASQASS